MDIDFSKDFSLENDVVLLRPLRAQDFKELSKFALAEPTLWTYSLLPANGLENMQIYIDKALESRSNETAYPFVVIDKRTNEIAGSTRFYDYQKDFRTTQLGYTWYGKKFQRTGLNRNCKLLMLQFAFESLKMERVEFRADATNARSITAMKNIGCTEEGILRSNCSSPGGRRDSIILSILKHEWESTVKSNLISKIK